MLAQRCASYNIDSKESALLFKVFAVLFAQPDMGQGFNP
jgi:hypothetical protein